MLSGGLDSSLGAGIAAEGLHEKGETLTCVTISMEGGTDLPHAIAVAEHLNSKFGNVEHIIVDILPEDLIETIPQVIYTNESLDTTTMRASATHQAVNKYISKSNS